MAVLIDTLQWFEWAVGIAELGLEVVLDDRRAMTDGPRQQRAATLQRHRDTQRILVRRRDEHDAGCARDALHDDAVAVHLDWYDPDPERVEQRANVDEAGIL